ncbi:MAG: GFA family protein [Gammaproteobacteria bacterium]|nr:GFA family protein [Gammaproteobacteria bacterium]
MAITGSCVCGAVTYRVDGKLTDARSCHCSICRKAFSAQASATALVDPATFNWVSGEALLSRFESNSDTGVMFCSRCGSTLCGTQLGEVHSLTLGCVDGDPGITLSRHIFVGSKAPWEVIPKGIPQYDRNPLAGDKKGPYNSDNLTPGDNQNE